MISCWTGERKAAHQDARRRAGITRESTWLQSTPDGDVAVVLIEADDLGVAMGTLATSDEPFDRWFREHLRSVHGFDLADGMPLPELILDYRAEIEARQ
jgi:hypothetical protein